VRPFFGIDDERSFNSVRIASIPAAAKLARLVGGGTAGGGGRHLTDRQGLLRGAAAGASEADRAMAAPRTHALTPSLWNPLPPIGRTYNPRKGRASEMGQ
jgi:hypothetical protein